MMIDDINNQDSVRMRVILCSSPNFPSSKSENDDDHILLEEWMITPRYLSCFLYLIS